MWEPLNNIAQTWWNWQWPMLWQTALLIGIIVVIDLLIRKWAWPQLRYSLWLLVLVKLLLPPGLASSVSVTAPLSEVAKQTIAVPQPSSPSSTSIETTPSPALPTALPMPVIDVPTITTPVIQEAPPIESIETPIRIDWQTYVMATWLVGVVTLAFALTYRFHKLHREHRPSDQQIPDWFENELRQVAQDLKLRRLPQVVVSHRVCCPAVFGLFRPILLVPEESLPNMSPSDARHILLHELAHIVRGDLLVHSLHMLLLIAYWPNPLLWLMRKHLQNLRELCCDATVARYLKEDTPAYRETLIETAKGLLAQPVDPGLGLLGLFENSSWILTRLQWLEKKTWRYWRLRIAMVALVVLVMITCVLPMAPSKAQTSEEVADVNISKTADLDSMVQNDSLVKLLGICDYPVEDEDWWNTQGEIIPNGTIAPPQWHIERHKEVGHQYKLFAFQIAKDNIQDISITWKMPDSPRSSYFPTYIDRQAEIYYKTQYLLGNFPEDMNFTDVTLGLAIGQWQYAAGTSGRAEQEGFSADSITDRDVTLHQAQVKDGLVHMSISHLLGKDYSCRIVAIDTSGETHLPISKSNSGGALRLCQGSFDLPLEDIKYFELQARPYEWIVFKDVPLKPHLKLASLPRSTFTPAPNYLNNIKLVLKDWIDSFNQACLTETGSWIPPFEKIKLTGVTTEHQWFMLYGISNKDISLHSVSWTDNEAWAVSNPLNLSNHEDPNFLTWRLSKQNSETWNIDAIKLVDMATQTEQSLAFLVDHPEASNTIDPIALDFAEIILDRQHEQLKWLLSFERMKRLSPIVAYAYDHNAMPHTIDEAIKQGNLEEITEEYQDWLDTSLVYIGHQVVNLDQQQYHQLTVIPIAYDQQCLKEVGRSPVLFADGHVQPLTTNQLKALRSDSSEVDTAEQLFLDSAKAARNLQEEQMKFDLLFERLKHLSSIVELFVSAKGQWPSSIIQLREEGFLQDITEDFDHWLKNDLIYLGDHVPDPNKLSEQWGSAPMAYDRELKISNRVPVLFRNGTIKGMTTEQLRASHIAPPETLSLENSSPLIAETTLALPEEQSAQWNLSMERISHLSSIIELYYVTNANRPESINQLLEQGYLFDVTSEYDNWLHDDLVDLGYQIPDLKEHRNPLGVTPIAYDQTLLKLTGRTPVIFVNGQVKPLSEKQLAILGVNRHTETFGNQQKMHILLQLGLSILMYYDDNEQQLPSNIQQLETIGYLQIEDSLARDWLRESVHYLGGMLNGLTPKDYPSHRCPLAYDKALYDRGEKTLTIYLDGHVESISTSEFNQQMKCWNQTTADSGSGALQLAQPEYEWWLKEPKQQIVINEGDELEIRWQIDQELYEAIDSFAVGIKTEGIDISDNLNYQWLSVDIPSTVRKTHYKNNQPTDVSPYVEELNRARGVPPLTQGLYNIIVFGFRDRKSDWAYTVKHELQCVATAKLIVNANPNSSPTEQSQDIPTQFYTVQPGDTLESIGKRFQIPWQWIAKTNEVDPETLQAYQDLKVITGPVHAKVYRSSCKLELYADGIVFETYKVGLGQEGHVTPTGLWSVAQGGKMIRPQWTDAETGQVYQGDEPDYPLGERWIGLKGIEGDAIGKQGYAIHGSNNLESIEYATNGCIRISNQDVIEVYDLLLEGVSTVEVVE